MQRQMVLLVAALVALVLVGWWQGKNLLLKPAEAQLARATAQRDALTSNLKDLQAKVAAADAAGGEALRLQGRTLGPDYAVALPRLLAEAGSASGAGWRISENTVKSLGNNLYQVDGTIELTGNIGQVQVFLERLESHPVLVRVHNPEISAGEATFDFTVYVQSAHPIPGAVAPAPPPQGAADKKQK
jgi:hypothetical protein